MKRKTRIKEQDRQRQRLILMGKIGGAILLVILLVVVGETIRERIESGDSPIIQTGNKTLEGTKFSSFSGEYVEDGSGVPVEKVAAILVTNKSDSFLDLATLEYEIDGKKATFVVTGLPAGKSAWVLEKNKMTVTEQSSYKYIDRNTSFKDGVVDKTDKISISSEGDTLTAVNNTNKKLEGVFVYYKALHTDGNYFGGITYMIEFGDLEPGEKVTKLAGHYEKDKTEIVRIGWKQ